MGEINWGALRQQADDATKPIPDGDYSLQITKSELKIAQTGAQMIAVVLTVTTGPAAGRNIWNNFVFSPDKPFALKMWFDALGAFGLDDKYFATGPSLEQIAATLLNAVAIGTVGQREYPKGSGTMRNEINGWKRGGTKNPQLVTAGGSPSAPPTPSGASSPSQPPVPSTPVVPPTPANATASAPPTPSF